MVSIVAAIDSKRGLGKNNQLLFKIPEDFERMKKLTMGHPIIMGRRTFESIGRVLLGRTNIIITKNPEFQIPDLAFQGETLEGYVMGSLEKAIEVAKKSPGSEEIIVFGGGQVFKEALEKDLVDVLHLTIVEGDFGADTFFPDYSKFKRVLSKHQGKSGEYNYTFLELSK
ncbi:MAG: dihydrofolate reductase [Candidatus Levybacteria bacterium]|nr:dihydrofolate reductase [Candidatus Levybacteria bacterium]